MMPDEPKDRTSQNTLRLLGTALQSLLWCVAIAVLGQNFLLLKQNRQLQNAPALHPASRQTYEISEGNKLKNLAGLDLDGKFAQIAFPSAGSSPEKLLIIAMSPTCPICESNRQT